MKTNSRTVEHSYPLDGAQIRADLISRQLLSAWNLAVLNYVRSDLRMRSPRLLIPLRVVSIVPLVPGTRIDVLPTTGLF